MSRKKQQNPLTIRIEGEQLQRLNEAAAAAGQSRHGFMRAAVEAAVEQQLTVRREKRAS